MGFAALPLCFAPPLLLLLPGFYAFVGAAWGLASFYTCVGASSLSVLLIAGINDFSSLQILALYIPASFILLKSLRNRLPWRNAAVQCSLAMALGLYAMLCLPSLLAGNGPFGDFETVFRLLGEQFAATAPQMGASESVVEQICSYVAYLQLEAASLVTSTMVALAMAAGLAAPLIARGLCSVSVVETRPMARFSNWQLGNTFVQGLVVLLVGTLLATMLDINNIGAVISAVECIVGGPFILMGLCCMAYIRAAIGKGTGYLIVLYVVMLLFLNPGIYILVTIGFLDRVVRIRKQRPLS